MDQAAQCIVALGKGAQLAKLDLESAYRMIPIHPDDRHLLGMRWKNEVWIDTALPFGLRSAPKVFNVMADCLHWFFEEDVPGCQVIHYLDDFLFMGPPGSTKCRQALQQALGTCQNLGRVRNEKIDINEINWTPNQCTEYLNLYIKTAKRAAPNP